MPDKSEFKKIEEVQGPEPAAIEMEELKEKISEELDFRTASFVREHIDIDSLGDSVFLAVPENQSTQRRLSFEDFKHKITTFRENLAKGQLELENIIRQNPDIPAQQLHEEVYKICQKFQLSSRQIDNFLAAADAYLRAHQDINGKIAEFKNKFGEKWPEELFSALFGHLPSGQIKIEVMPMSVYFKIYDIADYVLADGEDEATTRASGGAKLNRDLPIPAFNHKTIIENSSMVEKGYGDQAGMIAVHEEEHVIHGLYPTESFIKKESIILNLFKSDQELEQSVKEALVHLARWLEIAGWQKGAKSEILAFLKDGRDIGDIRNFLLDESEKGLYYFIKDWRSDIHLAETIVRHF